jgi:outer membrane protein TolC
MNKWIFSFFLAWMMISQMSWAQEVKLTLEDAVAIAQNNSPIADAVRSNRRAALWRYKAFRAGLLPNLSLSGDAPGYNNSINPITQPDGTVRFVGQQQATLSGSLDVSQAVPYTGGRFELSSGLNRVFFYDANTDEWSYLWQSTPLVLSYIQPIFQFNQLAWQLELEPVRNELSRLQFTESMEEVALNATRAYFDAYLAKINLENAQFNVGVNDTIYNISVGRFNVGKIAENDVLQSELALLNARTNEQNAQLAYEKALQDLKIQLGLPVGKTIEVDAPEALGLLSIDVDLALEYAQKNSSFLTSVKLREMEAEQSLDQAESNAGLNANLTARYGLNQTSTEFGDLYSNLQDRSFFTIGFQIPILNWGQNNARIQAAREQAKETQKRVSVDREQYNVDVEFRVRQFMLQQNQLIIAQKSDTIAQRRYEVTRARYLIGKVDITNLLIAQNEKDNARTGLIRAQRDYWLAWYELRRSTLFDFIQNEPIRYFE